MHTREACALAIAAGLVAPVLLALFGCPGDAARRDQLTSDNPLDRAEAIVQVSQARDRKAVQTLVNLLDDPSSGVRMYTILALRDLTGEDFGYRYYENEVVRATAVRRWRDALRAGAVALKWAPTSAPAEEAEPGSSGAAEERDAASDETGLH